MMPNKIHEIKGFKVGDGVTPYDLWISRKILRDDDIRLCGFFFSIEDLDQNIRELVRCEYFRKSKLAVMLREFVMHDECFDFCDSNCDYEFTNSIEYIFAGAAIQDVINNYKLIHASFYPEQWINGVLVEDGTTCAIVADQQECVDAFLGRGESQEEFVEKMAQKAGAETKTETVKEKKEVKMATKEAVVSVAKGLGSDVAEGAKAGVAFAALRKVVAGIGEKAGFPLEGVPLDAATAVVASALKVLGEQLERPNVEAAGSYALIGAATVNSVDIFEFLDTFASQMLEVQSATKAAKGK